MGSRLSLLGLGGLLLAAVPLAAQAPATRTLANPEEYAESFDLVSSFRELANGKLLLVDNGPRALFLVDFKSGQQTQVGRKGQGPGEYQFPGELIPYLGDTTLLVDRASRRMLPVTPDGKMGKVVTFPEEIQGFSEPRGSDARGRIYFQASPYNFGGGQGITTPDSTVIVRWERGSNKADTIGQVKLASTKMNVSSSGNSRAITMMQQPYAGQDDWAVTRDGRVGVVRIGDYHVDWLGDRPAKGTAVKYSPVKVGAAEKDAFMARMKDTRNRVSVTSGGAGPGPGMRPSEPKAPDFDWPEVKPPFVPRNVFTSPEGELWVQRSAPAADSTPVYDVFNASGNLASRVSLPKGRRLVGLGAGVAYATRTDEDGLQWLERYKR